MRRRLSLLLALVCLSSLAGGAARAEETLPAKPTRYFNDYALAVKPETAEALNQRLADFERETSNQILVAIFPRLQTESDIADYTQRVFRAWQPGQAGRDNGAILFVFLQDHKLRIQTGRGLEGAIPDALARRIIGDEIAPLFRAGDMDGGLTAGVNAMLAAAKGEYQGTGRTVADRRRGNRNDGGGLPLTLIFLLVVAFLLFNAFARQRARRGMVYGPGGARGMGGGGPIFIPFGGFGGGGFGGGGGGFGGGGGGGDSGGFDSGGGDSGGGGASGDW